MVSIHRALFKPIFGFNMFNRGLCNREKWYLNIPVGFYTKIFDHGHQNWSLTASSDAVFLQTVEVKIYPIFIPAQQRPLNLNKPLLLLLSFGLVGPYSAL